MLGHNVNSCQTLLAVSTSLTSDIQSMSGLDGNDLTAQMLAMNMNIAQMPHNIEAPFPVPENQGNNYWTTVCLVGLGIGVILSKAFNSRLGINSPVPILQSINQSLIPLSGL